MSSSFEGIAGWQKTSFIDYPGTVSTVLFFEGCNLRCPYCHNPDIVLRKLPQISWTSVQSFLHRRKTFIEGVVLSGGEPTLHVFLPDLVREIRESGFKIKIDTNGTDPEMISRCEPDYLALDIKTEPLRYTELGYKDKEFGNKLRNAIGIVKKMGSSAEVRITMASPFINEDVVYKIAELLAGVQKVFLQPLKLTSAVLDSSFGPQNVIPTAKIKIFRDIIASSAGSCVIRGE